MVVGEAESGAFVYDHRTGRSTCCRAAAGREPSAATLSSARSEIRSSCGTSRRCGRASRPRGTLCSGGERGLRRCPVARTITLTPSRDGADTRFASLSHATAPRPGGSPQSAVERPTNLLARSSPPLRGGGLDDCSRASHGKEGRQRMIPGQFDYVRPGSLDEALRILRDREGEAKILSGGYSLIPLIKLRLAQPALLVDIQALDGPRRHLRGSDGWLAHRLPRHASPGPRGPDHRRSLPDDPGVAGGIGDPQVRNWGTIGGSVAHADPASDWPAALLAINATIVCRGADGDREIKARDFFLDTFTTAIEPTEVLTEIRIPSRGPRERGARTRSSSGGSATSPPSASAAIVILDADGHDQARGHRRDRGLGVAVRRSVARRPHSPASSRATRRSRPPAPRRPRPASPPRTSGVRPTTSGRWSPRSRSAPSGRAAERAQSFR